MKKNIKSFIIAFLIMLVISLVNINVVYASNSNSTSTSTSTSTERQPNAEFMHSDYVSCGTGMIKNIPAVLPKMTSGIYNVLMVAVPVILVIFGVIDLVKGISSQKEDEIKKGREAFMKRTIIGVITFLIVMLTKVFINILASSNFDRIRIIGCIDCVISNKCTKQAGPYLNEEHTNRAESDSNSNSTTNSTSN